MKRATHPTAFIVFGATGDLTQRKLYPALYELARRDLLPPKFYLYGIAREERTDDMFRKQVRSAIKEYVKGDLEEKALGRLLKHVTYISADLKAREGYQKLENSVKKRELSLKKGIQRLFYLALPPGIFPYVAKSVESCHIGKALCTRDKILSRIIVEKPFGSDFASAKKLDVRMRKAFNEEQIYRIDHYLGKEAFQNVMTFRFGNQLFDHSWDNTNIESIQIHALETVGLEKRFSYYDSAGALRDMVQSHLLQFLSILTMDEPASLEAKSIHKEKQRVLEAVRPFGGKAKIVRGQYAGYTSSKNISKSSKTETFASLALEVNLPRWRGVPIILRTGKKLGQKETSATIVFKQPKLGFLHDKRHPLVPNMLHLQISPAPSISMRINVHSPGVNMGADEANMHYCRGERFKEPPIGDYERLLIEVMKGDQTLFTSSKEVLAQWKIVEPFLKKSTKPVSYKKGSLGPKDPWPWYDSIVACPFDT